VAPISGSIARRAPIVRPVKAGDSVRLAIDEYERGEFESSMLHACNAVDGTAAEIYPNGSVSRRFTTLLRNSIDIF
jgi:hypothetical protein